MLFRYAGNDQDIIQVHQDKLANVVFKICVIMAVLGISSSLMRIWWYPLCIQWSDRPGQKGPTKSGGGCHFGTFLLLWRRGVTCTPTLWASRGWHRLVIATTCCNDHTLTFTHCLWSLVPQAWQRYLGATIPRPRICRSRKSAPSWTWTGDLCFDTKCNGLTDLAKRVQPTPVVDATLAPSYSFEGAGGLAPKPFWPLVAGTG